MHMLFCRRVSKIIVFGFRFEFSTIGIDYFLDLFYYLHRKLVCDSNPYFFSLHWFKLLCIRSCIDVHSCGIAPSKRLLTELF